MRFAICNETFQGWDWPRTCALVADCGYDAVEIAPFTFAADCRDLSPSARKDIRRVAGDAGLAITGLHWLLVSPPGLSVTSPDPVLRETTAEYLVALTDLCADLGGHVMVFGSPAQRRIADGLSETDARRYYIDSLRPALDRAQSAGVVICVEPLPPPEANFILTLAEAASLVAEIGHPAARTIFDVKSACSEGKPLTDLIEQHAGIIAHVHANDANRRGPGFGDTDYVPILSALTQVGFDGYVSVEVFDYSPDPETIARRSIRYLRECADRAEV